MAGSAAVVTVVLDSSDLSGWSSSDSEEKEWLGFYVQTSLCFIIVLHIDKIHEGVKGFR